MLSLTLPMIVPGGVLGLALNVLTALPYTYPATVLANVHETVIGRMVPVDAHTPVAAEAKAAAR